MATTVTDTKTTCPQRGIRIKQSALSVDITGVKLVGKNPAKPGTRFYGFVMAFIGKAKRVATVKQMVDAYWAHQDSLKMNRDPIEAVIRDLANYLSAWTAPDKSGKRGLHLNVIRVDGRPVPKTDLTAKYEFVSWREDSKFADKARDLGWTVA